MEPVRTPPPAFRLTDADKLSDTWQRLEKHLKAEIERLRLLNDGNLDPVVTANTRGQIAALRNLLSRADGLPVVPDLPNT